MNTTTVYIISYSAVIAVFSIQRISKLISFKACEKLLLNIQKWTLYTLIVLRQRSTLNISLLAVFYIFLYTVVNVVNFVLGLFTGIQFAQCLKYLFAINAVLLFLKGRTNLISDKVLYLLICNYSLIYYQISQVYILKRVLYALLIVSLKHSCMANIKIIVYLKLPCSY